MQYTKRTVIQSKYNEWYNSAMQWEHVAIPDKCYSVMCGVVGLVENRKRICLFDMPNHYVICPDSGSVRTAQMKNIV